MKFFLISDNIDTQMGMRLAGIEGVVVHERQEVLEVLEGKFSIVDEYAQEKGTDDVQEAIKTLVWDQINTRVNQLLEEKTLKQLMASFADENRKQKSI